MNPKVTVLMSCRNSNPKLLEKSIKAVLTQTFSDFEFVIIDDGSDKTLEPLVRSISTDSRIRVYRLEPSGLGAALTYGIEQAKGEYIARIDDDDLMAHNRLQVQVSFLDDHPEVSCVGSQRYSYTGNRYIKHRKFPLSHNEILKTMLSLRWAMAHTALMYRRESVKKIGCYRIKGTGEDMDLILQLGTVGKLANIDEYLLYYHISRGSLSAKSSQLPGHLWALEKFKENKEYLQFSDIVDNSITILKQKIAVNETNHLWKTWLLLKLILLFGKELPREILG